MSRYENDVLDEEENTGNEDAEGGDGEQPDLPPDDGDGGQSDGVSELLRMYSEKSGNTKGKKADGAFSGGESGGNTAASKKNNNSLFLTECVIIALLLIFTAICIIMIAARQNEPPLPTITQSYISQPLTLDIGAVENTENTAQKPKKVLSEYKEYYDINKDLVGWIKIDGTFVDDPVVQIGGFNGTTDSKFILEQNSYYLDKNLYGDYDREGLIIADYRAVISPEGRAANTLLYGHNMSSGHRFHDIAYYDPNFYGEYGEQFYKNHPVIEFDTIYEKGKYKVFAAMQTNIYTADGDPVFHYNSTYTFKNREEFYDYYGKVLDRSMFYNPDVDLRYGDEVIVLSTCDFTIFSHVKDLRFVVFARRVREGESEEVDISKYYVNPDPLYYDYYYQVFGTEWGGRKWDPALLKGYVPQKADAAAATSSA